MLGEEAEKRMKLDTAAAMRMVKPHMEGVGVQPVGKLSQAIHNAAQTVNRLFTRIRSQRRFE